MTLVGRSPGRGLRRVLGRVRDGGAENGSTIPLIIGFFLIALMFAGAAVMASDAFNRQRDLQSVCDGAAAASANSVDLGAVRGHLGGATALPLTDVQEAADEYVAQDAGRGGVSVTAQVSGDGTEVGVDCSRRSRLAFAAMFGKRDGIQQHAHATARAPIG